MKSQELKLKKQNGNYVLQGFAECEACHGTGLYVGIRERNGAAVICYNCKGTGVVEVNMKFVAFKKRKTRNDVTRVFQKACGYVITDRDITNDEGKSFPVTKYGTTYNKWLDGETPKPLEFLICPFSHQSQDLSRAPQLRAKCDDLVGPGGTITECPRNKDKHLCWAEYHKESGR